MKDPGATRRYSAALFRAVESDKSARPADVLRELKTAEELMRSNAELARVMNHALFPADKKKSALSAALLLSGGKLSKTTLNFMHLLIAKKRLDLLPFIMVDFENLIHESNNTVKAYVASAAALDEESKKAMEAKLSKIFGKTVIVDNHVDGRLLAGVVVKAGGTVIDNSLRTQIKNMKLRFEHGY